MTAEVTYTLEESQLTTTPSLTQTATVFMYVIFIILNGTLYTRVTKGNISLLFSSSNVSAHILCKQHLLDGGKM